MKFQPDTLAGVNVISRHEPGQLWVAKVLYTRSALVPWTGDVLAWGVDQFTDLAPEHFERVAQLRPEVVIFGSGQRLRFPAPALLKALISQRVGVETMDMAAAARTYNVLVNEGRSVLGAFLIET